MAEYTGGSVSYYRATIRMPTSGDIVPYVAECNDLIKALRFGYAEGNIFKALWRMASHEVMGLVKEGNNTKYDAEKILFFAIDVAQKHGVDVKEIFKQRGYEEEIRVQSAPHNGVLITGEEPTVINGYVVQGSSVKPEEQKQKPYMCDHCDEGWLGWPMSPKKEGSPCHICRQGESWIEWDGNVRPVEPESRVLAKFRDGSTGIAEAKDWNWGRMPRDNDCEIIGYRVVKE